MKNKIKVAAITLATAALLSGCGNKVANESNSSAPSMFTTVEIAKTWMVVYHKETKVLYVVSNDYHNYGNFTVLLDADGSPLLWEGQE